MSSSFPFPIIDVCGTLAAAWGMPATPIRAYTPAFRCRYVETSGGQRCASILNSNKRELWSKAYNRLRFSTYIIDEDTTRDLASASLCEIHCNATHVDKILEDWHDALPPPFAMPKTCERVLLRRLGDQDRSLLMQLMRASKDVHTRELQVLRERNEQERAVVGQDKKAMRDAHAQELETLQKSLSNEKQKDLDEMQDSHALVVAEMQTRLYDLSVRTKELEDITEESVQYGSMLEAQLTELKAFAIDQARQSYAKTQELEFQKEANAALKRECTEYVLSQKGLQTENDKLRSQVELLSHNVNESIEKELEEAKDRLRRQHVKPPRRDSVCDPKEEQAEATTMRTRHGSQLTSMTTDPAISIFTEDPADEPKRAATAQLAARKIKTLKGTWRLAGGSSGLSAFIPDPPSANSFNFGSNPNAGATPSNPFAPQ